MGRIPGHTATVAHYTDSAATPFCTFVTIINTVTTNAKCVWRYERHTSNLGTHRPERKRPVKLTLVHSFDTIYLLLILT